MRKNKTDNKKKGGKTHSKFSESDEQMIVQIQSEHNNHTLKQVADEWKKRVSPASENAQEKADADA